MSELTVAVRRAHRLRLPDAIIRASARRIEAILVTRDHGFGTDDPAIRVPYSLS